MPVRPRLSAVAVALLSALALPARAQPPTVSTVHPIFAAVPELPHGDEAHRRFAAAVARHKLGPVEVMDVPGPAAPRARDLLKAGRAAVEQKQFAEAEKALDLAVVEVNASGAAGLQPEELADVFLFLAMAAQKADWKDLTGPLKDITPAKAKQNYLRAAVLNRQRALLPRQFPPLAMDSWRLAVAEVDRRPRGSLLVRASSTALISIDGGPLKPGLLPAGELVYGDHWVRVEDAGRRNWSASIPLHEQSMEVEAPTTDPLSLDDRSAASHARRQGAAFALVAEPRPGRPVSVELRLVDVQTGNRRDATTVNLGDVGALETAVMRLDEGARRARLTDPGPREHPPALGDLRVSPVPPAPDHSTRFAEDPAAWARARWPLLTAVGVAVGSTVLLGILAASDDGK